MTPAVSPRDRFGNNSPDLNRSISSDLRTSLVDPWLPAPASTLVSNIVRASPQAAAKMTTVEIIQRKSPQVIQFENSLWQWLVEKSMCRLFGKYYSTADSQTPSLVSTSSNLYRFCSDH